ncbi:MAG: FecR domain-containing protein [Muribaculaceae bacterium]|nr:FecR domain-containing protein [Muribaculaceae bacterium]
MNSLLDKYRNEKLTGPELQRFREMLDTLDDDTLAQMLDEYDCSDRESIDSFTLPDDVVERMRRRCFEQTGITRARRTSRLTRWVLWAAAVLVPALMVSTIYLFNQSRDYRGMAETDIAIMTGEGERVTTQLPDGTRVELNYMSELRYTLTAFNSHQRRISFSGEGFFDVTKNEESQFIISSKD